MVVIPKDKKTSQNLASDAHWCTSTKTEENNRFDQYVIRDLTALIYVISKTSNEKYAIRFCADGQIIELRNKRNTAISKNVFKAETKYDPTFLVAQARNSPDWREFIAVVESSPSHLSEKLCEFAKKGNLDGVKYCLDTGADIHIYADWPLQMASRNGYIEVVKLLLEYGADIHANNDRSLREAAKNGENGHTEVVRLLLAHSLKINDPFSSEIIEECIESTENQEIKKLLKDYMEALK